MKQVFTLVLFFCTSLSVFAQLNDECINATDLGVAPNCDETTFYTNVGATASDIGIFNVPSCSTTGAPSNDVWFSFVASDTIEDYTITINGMSNGMGSDALSNPLITLYRGACGPNQLQELACLQTEDGQTEAIIEIDGLTPTLTYYIRVTDWSPTATPNWGTFNVCVDEADPINIIDEGGSTACSGMLFDSGGPDGDYGANEDFVYTICPTDFHNCINFTLDYYNMETGSDQLTLYDGPNTSSPVLGGVNGFNGDTQGGVCYSVRATSGCITVAFSSDAGVEFEGFAASWQCSVDDCVAPEVISVVDTATNDQIINSITTPQTVVTVTSVDCAPGAYGTFEANDPAFGLEKGLILSSGQIDDPAGFGAGIANPASTQASTNNQFPGDADLDFLSGATTSQDACIVEVDVFVATDQLTFDYIFGSEEYPEFTGGTFNDIFALLVSGPGIAGDPGLNDQVNVATLPDGTPVQINLVNNFTNWEYYRNNELSQTVVYDGLTSGFLGTDKALTASIDVTPCQTYHLKFAVADRVDGIYDSGVFISEIRGGRPELSVEFQNGIEYFVENCGLGGDQILIGLTEPTDEDTEFTVTLSGTATNGVDYILNIPPVVTIPAGETSLTYPIEIIGDQLVEGTETIVITLSNDFGCGNIELQTITVDLQDALRVEINDGLDTALVCQGTSTELVGSGAIDYFWQPTAIVSPPFGSEITATPTVDTEVVVTGSAGLCTDTDTIQLVLVDPQVDIQTPDPTQICQGDSVTLVAQNNVANSNLQWSPAFQFDDPNAMMVEVDPTLDSTLLFVTVELAGCVAMDSVFIEVDEFDFPEIFIQDTTLCESYPVQLTEQIDNTTTTYQWTPSNGVSNDTISGPLVNPDVSTIYTLIATSDRAFCADTAMFDIQVIPADVDLGAVEDSIFLCLGESFEFNASSTTNGVGLTFTPTDQITINGQTVTGTPTESFLLLATLETPECLVFDSVYVQVDSLPEMPITAIPDKDIYCPGDQVTLVSPIFEPFKYPTIDHTWDPTIGALTPDSLYNLILNAVETTTYVRTTTNNACVMTDSFTVNVVDLTALEITPDEPEVCAGFPVTLTAFIEGGEDYMWTPGELEGASVTVSPTMTTTYQVTATVEDCPVSGNVTVQVNLPPQLQLAPDQTICPGESVLLNGIEDESVTYVWTSSDGTFSSNEAMPTVSPTVSTTYTLVATNDCGETNASIIITVPNASLQVEGGGEYCESELPITLTANVNATGNSYLWSTGETTRTIQLNDISQAGTYSVTVTDACGGILNGSTTVSISQDFDLFLTAAPDTSTIFSGDPVVLTAATDPALNGAEFIWMEDGNQIPEMGNPITVTAPNVEGDQPINVTYSVDVINGACEQTASVTFVVEPSNIMMANVFMPNNATVEESNRVFRPITTGNVNISSFRIYNRWGQLIFEESGDNASWDGTRDGKIVPQDVYVYVVEFTKGLGEMEQMQGDVTLIR